MTIKDYYQLTKDNEYFFRFIKNIMNEMGITVKQLTDGICDESEWKNLKSPGNIGCGSRWRRLQRKRADAHAL